MGRLSLLSAASNRKRCRPLGLEFWECSRAWRTLADEECWSGFNNIAGLSVQLAQSFLSLSVGPAERHTLLGCLVETAKLSGLELTRRREDSVSLQCATGALGYKRHLFMGCPAMQPLTFAPVH